MQRGVHLLPKPIVVKFYFGVDQIWPIAVTDARGAGGFATEMPTVPSEATIRRPLVKGVMDVTIVTLRLNCMGLLLKQEPGCGAVTVAGAGSLTQDTAIHSGPNSAIHGG